MSGVTGRKRKGRGKKADSEDDYEFENEEDEDFELDDEEIIEHVPKPSFSDKDAFDGLLNYSTELKLVPDHPERPLWVCPDGHIFVEVCHP